MSASSGSRPAPPPPRCPPCKSLVTLSDPSFIASLLERLGAGVPESMPAELNSRPFATLRSLPSSITLWPVDDGSSCASLMGVGLDTAPPGPRASAGGASAMPIPPAPVIGVASLPTGVMKSAAVGVIATGAGVASGSCAMPMGVLLNGVCPVLPRARPTVVGITDAGTGVVPAPNPSAGCGVIAMAATPSPSTAVSCPGACSARRAAADMASLAPYTACASSSAPRSHSSS
mmetsp:Transcript_11741/g.49452  ORF Transcript_11741/g.49452 Transcript_11741/m.49452 type:complete len:232 (-) Transcript_11741:475-1170(-)